MHHGGHLLLECYLLEQLPVLRLELELQLGEAPHVARQKRLG